MTAAHTNRPLALAAVIASMFMIAIEATIVATVMPRIVGDLGGLQLYSWVFSAFLLTQTATTVVFGKLSDQLGRKKVMMCGLGIFLVGSVLCGFAWSMPSMIAFRLIQGFGAGAVQPTAITIVGDLYSAHERGRIQGYLASIWAISAILGPLAGSLIIQHASWAWIFWINVPVGVIAAVLLIFFLHENVGRKAGKIDHLSAGLFALMIAAIMADLTAVSTASGREIALVSAVAVVSTIAFVWQERRSPEPMISPKLWGRRAIAATNAASLLAGMAMIGLTTFLPVFVQGVMGQSALAAGFALSAMVLGWPIGSIVAAKLLRPLGVRPLLRGGALFIPVGAALFVVIDAQSPPFLAGLGSLLVGFGMGLLNSPSIVLIQEIVDWSERGSVTAAFLFARSLGSTLGATLFGATLNFGLMRAGFAAVSSEELRNLVTGAAGANAALRAALEQSLHMTFVSMFVIALAVAGVTLLIPRVSLERRRAPAE